jgi:phosphoribosylaminoimidazole carboxylase
MSQYKSQLLAILGLMPSFPKNVISPVVPATIMLNILGGAHPDSHKPLLSAAVALPNASLHMYGKASKPGRKIGHITVIGASMSHVEASIAPLIALADSIRAERKSPTTRVLPLVPESPQYLGAPVVAVTMGSDSDLPVMKPGIALLRDFGVPYSVNITSAHRTPARMTAFAETAAANGYKVIIAAAGGAAHLPGMVAASTALPVIGVPVKGSTLDGMDSLLSIVQMPRGVPVATVAINNSINAALLALRILGASDAKIRAKMEAYQQEMADGVLEKVDNLNLIGWEKYGEKK